jgi:hypothetical protein
VSLFSKEGYCFVKTDLSRYTERQCGDTWFVYAVSFLVVKRVLCGERLEKGLTVTHGCLESSDV